MNNNPKADIILYPNHNATGHSLTNGINDCITKKDNAQEYDATYDWIWVLWPDPSNSLVMNHGIGPNPSLKNKMNVQTIMIGSVLNQVPKIPENYKKIYLFYLFVNI